MAWSEEFVLSAGILLLAVVVLILMMWIAWYLIPAWNSDPPPVAAGQKWTKEMAAVHGRLSDNWAESFQEHMARRNEFWILFSQVLLSIIVIALITVLLLMRVISAEAGLPILSAIGGFAVSKGVQGARSSGGNRPVVRSIGDVERVKGRGKLQKGLA